MIYRVETQDSAGQWISVLRTYNKRDAQIEKRYQAKHCDKISRVIEEK